MKHVSIPETGVTKLTFLLEILESRRGTLAVVCMLALVRLFIVLVAPASNSVIWYIGAVTQRPDLVVSPLGGLFTAIFGIWEAIPFEHPPFSALSSIPVFLLPKPLFVLVVLFKLPVLTADLCIAYILYKLGAVLRPESNLGKYAALLWLVNPYVIFVNEIMGAVEVVPAMTIVLGVYFATTRRHLSGSMAIAAGAFFKLLPLVVAPAILFSARLRGASRLKILVYSLLVLLGVAVYMTWSGPINACDCPRFTSFLYTSTPLTQSISEMVLGKQNLISYGLGDYIGLSTFSVFLCYLLLYEIRPSGLTNTWVASLLILLSYLAFLDLQFEYLIWVIPLLNLANLSRKPTILPSALTYVTAFLAGFFSPQGYATGSSGFNFIIPSPVADRLYSVLANPLITLIGSSLLRTLFASLVVVTIWLMWPSRSGDSCGKHSAE